MQIKKSLFIAFAIALSLGVSTSAMAQSSSINAFSPYTFYSLGDMSDQGTTMLRSMGGAGVAFHNPISINYLNPASYSSVGQKSFILNVGLEGKNFYLKEKNAQGTTRNTSFNTFNIRDIAILFPLTKRVGFSFSVTPYSNVGYRVQKRETDIDIVANLGDVKYLYEGEGGITLMRAGIGVGLRKNLSIGVDAMYYLGSIDRYYGLTITPITSPTSYNSMSATNSESISRFLGSIGVQWDPIMTTSRMLSIGATYSMGGKLNAKSTRFIPSNDIYRDTVSLTSFTSDFRLASTYTLGVSYLTNKFNFNADYTYQDWGSANDNETELGKYVNTNSVKVGGQYTPNRNDIRSFLKRWSYRAGYRHSQYYMQVNGHNISENAITFGVGIPVKYTGLTNINVGFETGWRGSLKPGVIKDRFWKFSIGLSLFGEDYWFMKQKYD